MGWGEERKANLKKESCLSVHYNRVRARKVMKIQCSHSRSDIRWQISKKSFLNIAFKCWDRMSAYSVRLHTKFNSLTCNFFLCISSVYLFLSNFPQMLRDWDNSSSRERSWKISSNCAEDFLFLLQSPGGNLNSSHHFLCRFFFLISGLCNSKIFSKCTFLKT